MSKESASAVWLTLGAPPSDGDTALAMAGVAVIVDDRSGAAPWEIVTINRRALGAPVTVGANLMGGRVELWLPPPPKNREEWQSREDHQPGHMQPQIPPNAGHDNIPSIGLRIR